MPVEDSTPGQVQRLTAWLAAYRGDFDSERRALECLIAINPCDFETLDRMVAIAQNEGEADRAEELRRQKIEVQRLLARYDKLYKRNQTIRDAAEMASLARQLGQRSSRQRSCRRSPSPRNSNTVSVPTRPRHQAGMTRRCHPHEARWPTCSSKSSTPQTAPRLVEQEPDRVSTTSLPDRTIRSPELTGLDLSGIESVRQIYSSSRLGAAWPPGCWRWRRESFAGPSIRVNESIW